MERINNQPTFLDSLTSDLGGRRTSEFFSKCDRLIPWNELAEPLKGMYRNNTDKGGDPNYPLVMMIKCMMLQKWFNLSDPMLEEMLDSKHIDEFVENEKHSVWADSAYIDAKRKAELGRRGVFCGIIQKRVRGQKELTPSQKWHKPFGRQYPCDS